MGSKRYNLCVIYDQKWVLNRYQTAREDSLTLYKSYLIKFESYIILAK